MLICLLVLSVGAALAVWTPVLQFAVGLLATALAGTTVAVLRGVPAGQALLWGLAFFVCAQIGYVLGVGARMAYGRRFPKARTPDRSSAGRLHVPFRRG